MRKILFVCMTFLIVCGCGVNKQAQQIAALEKCSYKLLSAEQITVGGTDVSNLVNMEKLNLASLPGLALGLLTQDVPLKAKLNLEIKNPTSTAAAINNFEYQVLINNQELATGLVDQLVDVQPGGTTVVPVNINLNAYRFISNKQVMQDIANLLQSDSGATETKGLLTVKIKPSIKVAGALVKYPGFFTINKEITRKMLFK